MVSLPVGTKVCGTHGSKGTETLAQAKRDTTRVSKMVNEAVRI